jgi:hypothetical protein
MIKAVEIMHRTGGVSYNPVYNKYNPTTGYMVSLQGYERVTGNENHIQHVAEGVAKSGAEVLQSINTYLGLWYHKGKYYADISMNVACLDDAIKLGKEYNQIAIFDCTKMENIIL